MARDLRTADRAPRRRLGRRRLGEVARDRTAFVRALQPGLGARRRQPRDRAGRVVLPRLGRGPRRGARRHQPLQRDGEGDVAAVRRRAARRRPARRGRRQGDARRQRDPHRATARSTTRSRPRTKRSRATRRFLSYLPSSVDELPPRRSTPTTTIRSAATNRCSDAIPRDRRKVYKVRPIIEAVVDRDSWFELGRFNGRSAVTGLARLDGRPVAVLANDPYFYAGGWTAAASEKVDALRRSRRDVPSPGRALRRQSRLRHRHRRGEGRRRSATARGRSPRSIRRRRRGAR